ncbi:MAG TPA: IS1634 family transposase [Planctomycetaceae bacterium]|nr:IS1634 family transposase [Planctomycetaceae bacterium]
MFFRQKKSGSRTYLQIVENRWENGATRQRVVATLGRLDQLQESGQLDGLLKSGARFTEAVMVVSARDQGKGVDATNRRIGAPLVFQRLWEQTGCDQVLQRLLEGRRFEFSVERALFLTVLHRLVRSGSDRACVKWKNDYDIPGVAELQLHHLYRAMGWLGESLPLSDQKDKTPFGPRCRKDLVEEALFARRRDLFSSLDLVFFDTTSIYFEGNGGETLGERGKSKDHRPDLKQMVVGVVIDSEGRPVCCELWSGNTTDVKTLIPIVDRLRSRFHVGRICIVADRGMMSKETIEELESEARRWKYILGARMRAEKEVREEVLSRGGRYRVVQEKGKCPKAPAPLKVKEVRVGSRRYIVCLNEDQAKKDAADREATVASLREQLKRGDKALVDDTIRGHVFCSFLALALRHELYWRLRQAGHVLEWDDVIQDLEALQITRLTYEAKQFLVRSTAEGSCGKVFQAVGVALPPTVRRI